MNNSKTLFLVLISTILGFGFSSNLFAKEGWLTDYEQALKTAKEQDKLIIADFNGSDWCVWCRMLDEEVWSQEEFKEYAKDFVLLDIDFPSGKPQTENIIKQNQGLQRKYEIMGFPTVLILTAEGKKAVSTGYVEGGPKAWIENLKRLMKDSPVLKKFNSYSLGKAVSQAKDNQAFVLAYSLNSDDAGKKIYAALANSNKMIELSDIAFFATNIKDADTKAINKAIDSPLQNGEFALIDIVNKKSLIRGSLSSGTISEKVKSMIKAIPIDYNGGWIDDYKKAQIIAAKLDRKMLLNFTGSDWCGWCIKLDDEVFSKDEFKKYASENLVLVTIDFPSEKPQSDELKKRNGKLQMKYEVRGFPTIFITEPSGSVIAQMGYEDGGPLAYVEHIKTVISDSK